MFRYSAYLRIPPRYVLPRYVHHDLHSVQPKTEIVINNFSKLGLLSSLVEGLSAQEIQQPTPVQQSVIPRILNGENIVISASTGSGKTLAYILPLVQNLGLQELGGYIRQNKRPRGIILVPTRELAKQVLDTVKQLSHHTKVSSCGILGGESFAMQKKMLSGVVDIVVASPGRLLKHKMEGNVVLNHVTQVVVDEVDTMLMQGFGSDLRDILKNSLKGTYIPENASDHSHENMRKVQLTMASATITKAVRQLVSDIDGFNINFNENTMITTSRSVKSQTALNVKMSIVEVSGVHRSLPNVKHVVQDTEGMDKMETLLTILESRNKNMEKTMIFCNTVSSCRALCYYLDNHQIPFLPYHGDLNSKVRDLNLESFRSSNDTEHMYLVCTDIAARGLDIPNVSHIVIFDFPLNPIDYLHRAGRTGRAGRSGLVTSIITKRDRVLSDAIQASIAKGLPLDELSSAKRDYEDRGKLAEVVDKIGRNRKSVRQVRSGESFSKSKSNDRLVTAKGKYVGVALRQAPRTVVSRTSHTLGKIASLRRSAGDQDNRKSNERIPANAIPRKMSMPSNSKRPSKSGSSERNKPWKGASSRTLRRNAVKVSGRINNDDNDDEGKGQRGGGTGGRGGRDRGGGDRRGHGTSSSRDNYEKDDGSPAQSTAGFKRSIREESSGYQSPMRKGRSDSRNKRSVRDSGGKVRSSSNKRHQKR